MTAADPVQAVLDDPDVTVDDLRRLYTPAATHPALIGLNARVTAAIAKRIDAEQGTTPHRNDHPEGDQWN